MKIPKILFVEKSRFNLEITKLLLNELNFHLLNATDGQQALQIINTELPDLIIMDITLPKLDGGKCCAALKKDPNISSIPLIMIIDAEHPEDIIDVFKFGGNDHISKPLSKKSLLEIIRKYMPIAERRVPRINCKMPVVLQFDDTLVMVPCDNISVEGMFVKSSLEIKTGSEVKISFRLPGESKSKTKIRAKGHVVWISKKRSLQSRVQIGFGIQIDEIIGERISKRRNKELMAFIEANKE